MKVKQSVSFVLNAILNSYSEVFFAENRVLGIILLLVSFIDLWSGLTGILSVITVVLLARWLGYNQQMIRNGAYNMTQWLQFIMYRPNVLLIDTQGKTHIIRKKETLETFNRQEVVPEYLKDWKKQGIG